MIDVPDVDGAGASMHACPSCDELLIIMFDDANERGWVECCQCEYHDRPDDFEPSEEYTEKYD